MRKRTFFLCLSFQVQCATGQCGRPGDPAAAQLSNFHPEAPPANWLPLIASLPLLLLLALAGTVVAYLLLHRGFFRAVAHAVHEEPFGLGGAAPPPPEACNDTAPYVPAASGYSSGVMARSRVFAPPPGGSGSGRGMVPAIPEEGPPLDEAPVPEGATAVAVPFAAVAELPQPGYPADAPFSNFLNFPAAALGEGLQPPGHEPLVLSFENLTVTVPPPPSQRGWASSCAPWRRPRRRGLESAAGSMDSFSRVANGHGNGNGNGGGGRQVLCNVSGFAEEGNVTGILGPSGGCRSY